MKTTIGGKFWLEKDKEGIFSLGLTEGFVEQIGIIWNTAPRMTEEIKIGQTFLSFESSRMLMSLRSPMAGKIVEWNEDLIDTPNEITCDSFLIRIKPCDAEPVIQF